MILKEGEVCPFASNCPYHIGTAGPCYGAISTRMNEFKCEYVVNGRIVEGGVRLPADKTGKMKVIME